MEMSAAIVQAAKYLGAGICMGLAAIGPAIREGSIGAYATDAMARQPEMAGNLRISMIIADAIAETPGLYGRLISFMILFA